MKLGPHHGRRPAEEGRRFWVGLGISEAGFSLLELVIVAALLIILTTMYWGSISGRRERSQKESCENNLQRLFIAMEIYANDYQGKFPAVPGAQTAEEALDSLVPHYTVDTAMFICPGSKDPALPSGEPIRKRAISYAYYMGRKSADAMEVLMSDRQVNSLSKVVGELVFSTSGKPPGNNHGKSGGNFLFCDGHTASSPANTSVSLVLTQGVSLLNPKPR